MKWVKFLLLSLLLIFIILVIRACGGFSGNGKKSVMGDSIDRFVKQTKGEYPDVTGVELYTMNDHLIIIYTFSSKSSGEMGTKMQQIFDKTYDFISTDEIIQKILTQKTERQNAHVVWIEFKHNSDSYLYRSQDSPEYKSWMLDKNGSAINNIFK